MLVLGGSGQPASPQVLLGSSAAELTRRVTSPVVAVREALTRQSGARRIIVGVDGLAASAGAVHCGFDTAARRGLDVIAVHVWSDLPLSRHSERASRSRTSSYGETGQRCSRSSWMRCGGGTRRWACARWSPSAGR
jgi:nucleotide-binding universal stress UspA family protein